MDSRLRIGCLGAATTGNNALHELHFTGTTDLYFVEKFNAFRMRKRLVLLRT